jgi:hypothetical protein
MQVMSVWAPLRLFVAGWLAFSPAADAQQSSKVAVEMQVHEFAYKAISASDATVLDSNYPFTVVVTHKGEQRYVDSFQLVPTGETIRYFKAAVCRPSAFKAADNGTQELSCLLIANSDTSWLLRILARTKMYPLIAEPRFATAGGVVNSPFVQVRIQAGLLPVCLGGFVGALLFALFRMASAYLDVARTRNCENVGWAPLKLAMQAAPSMLLCIADKVSEALVFAIRGLLVALIFIFLSEALGSANLPFSFKVEDFFGGVFVGLLSLPISAWIASKLGLSKG